MVRIRKKTSNRSTTAHRAKIKHKARETKKKAKKEAKRNPNLHKRKKKDLGIPNSFPFKEQILTEVAAARKQALEEKQRKNELKQSKPVSSDQHNASHPIKVLSDSKQSQQDGDINMDMDDEVPPLIDTSIPNTAAALQVADVVICVLDARDPLSYRSAFVERIVTDKPLFFILNKVDLVPRESTKSWLSLMRTSSPTFLFRSASRHIPVDVLTTKGGQKAKPQDDDALGVDVLMKALRTIQPQKEGLTVTLIGMTNVGKSAIINSIQKKSTLVVYNPLMKQIESSPSTTPHPQSVTLKYKNQSYRFIDTPGFPFIPSSGPKNPEEVETQRARDILLRNRGNISKIKDPLPAALYILSRAVVENIMVLYNLPAVQTDDYHGVLAGLARKEGALQKKGAVIDFQGAARALVRDWKTGRLAFYSMPQSGDSRESKQVSKPLDPRFTPIFEETDPQLLLQIPSKKELRRSKGALVQLRAAVMDMRKVDLEANAILSDEDSEDSDDDAFSSSIPITEEKDFMAESDSGSGSAGTEEDDDEEVSLNDGDLGLGNEDKSENASSGDDDSESPIELLPPPKLSRKQQRAANQSERDPGKSDFSKKKVSFAPYTKAGAKIRKNPSISKSTSSQKSKVEISKTRRAVTKGSTDQPEGDTYDFSRYF